MTYAQIAEWVWENFDVENYFTPEELIFDVKNRFAQDMAYFPIQAEDNIKEVFQHRRELQEMDARAAEQEKLTEYVGAPIESITDEIIRDISRPEIELIPPGEFATTRETVKPTRIEKLAKDTWFSRLSRGLSRFLRLRKE